MVFATFEVAVIVYAARRLYRRGSFPPTLWSTLTVLVVLWTLQGLVVTQGRTPGENRYLTPAPWCCCSWSSRRRGVRG
ncbi:MAG: hypothetical protein ACJ75S_04875 [Solirubrobacterales bacterium]